MNRAKIAESITRSIVSLREKEEEEASKFIGGLMDELEKLYVEEEKLNKKLDEIKKKIDATNESLEDYRGFVEG